jgi:hypothetical protein
MDSQISVRGEFMAAQHKAMTWSGWILSGLLGLLLTFSGVMKLSGIEDIAKEFDRLGYAKEAALAIGIVELACVAIYLFPQTSILGAILLTGYLGGATATHVRIQDPFLGPIVIGVLVWLGLFLREPRLRAILPWRRAEV